ncbi:ubiquitin fusion degradation protein UFD1-domain-containing protein [Aspergillus californicus]
MDREQDQLRWSSQFTVAPSQLTPKLPGDKIVLPQSALEQLLAAAPLQEVSSQRPPRPYTSNFDPFNPHTFAAESHARERGLDRQHKLPHPLTFRLLNPQNDRVIYAGIREFSARENEIGLSASIREALDVDDVLQSSDENGTEGNDGAYPVITVQAKQLPKGTYVRLRPLEAGYDPEDWKALLERHLRDNYTTLTTGEVLAVPGGQDGIFRFLADRVEPEGEGICVVDTDLEVDIVALSEDQARETLRRRLAKESRAPVTEAGTSVGAALDIGADVTGQVLPGEYVDYELRKWEDGNTIEKPATGGRVCFWTARQQDTEADQHRSHQCGIRRGRSLVYISACVCSERARARRCITTAVTSAFPLAPGTRHISHRHWGSSC